jgi:predicted PurR-regulated permease PerM
MADRPTRTAPTAETKPAPDGKGTEGPAPGDGAPAHPPSLESPPDEHPLTLEPAVPPARVEPVVIPRWIQAIALAAGILLLWAVASAARAVVLIFVVAAVVALIVNPLVKLLRRRARVPRGLAIFVVYIGFVAVLVGIGAALASPVSNQVRTFQRDVPGIVDSANKSLTDVQSWLDRNHIGIKLQSQGQSALSTIEKNVLKGSGSLVKFTTSLLTSVAKAALAVILTIVISIYMLVYSDRIGRVVRSVMPPSDGSPEDDFPLRVQKAVFGYVRGQFIFSLIMGFSAGIALWIFGAVGIFPDGQRYALFFGVFYGLMELVPFIGPVLGALPPVLVALFEDPLTAVWVALLFLALQQLEGHIVAPQVFSRALRINPLLVLLALLVGGEVYGLVGALVALPIAAVLRETIIYMRGHTVLEPWGTPSFAAMSNRRKPPDDGPDAPGQ